MKYLSFILLICGFSASAQLDNPNTINSGGSISTPTLNTTTTRSAPSLSKRNNSFYNRPQKARLEEKEEKVDITENDGFVEPEVDFKPKYLEQGNETKMDEKFKKNQYFGDFTTTGDEITIICRDHQAVDGDLVKIYQDGEVVVERIALESQYKKIYLSLNKGFNKIEIEALNQGASGPNTAAFQVIDKSGKVIFSNQWNLATGYKGSFIVVNTD